MALHGHEYLIGVTCDVTSYYMKPYSAMSTSMPLRHILASIFKMEHCSSQKVFATNK